MSERPSLEKSMSLASVIISALIIFIVLMAFSFSKNLPANIRNSSGGASTPPSPSSAPSSSPAPASGGSGWHIPSWLGPLFLTIAGLWLILKVLAFKGAPDNLEAVLAVIIALAGAILLKDGKRFAGFFLSGLIIVLVLFPGIMTWLQGVRQSQINPPGEMAPIVINRDGEYDLPARPLKVCFTRTGDTANLLVNKVDIAGVIYEQSEEGCKDISAKGKVFISLLSGKPYSEQVKSQIGMTDVDNNYEYYKKIGFGDYPIIKAR